MNAVTARTFGRESAAEAIAERTINPQISRMAPISHKYPVRVPGAVAACPLLQSACLKDPLLGPVAAIAAGILVARFVPFRSTELLAAAGAFLILGLLSMRARNR